MRKPNENEARIQPVISQKTYDALMMVRVKERTTIAGVVERAVKEYVDSHYPDIADVAKL